MVLVYYGLRNISESQRLPLSWLLLASLFFYGWWEARYPLLLLTSITVNFALGNAICYFPEGADTDNESPLNHLLGSFITYRIAMGPQQGRKVFTLQTLPDCSDDPLAYRAGNVAGFSLHAGVTARAHERTKLERLCRYIALQGCRVLRRLGTIASAQDRRCPPGFTPK